MSHQWIFDPVELMLTNMTYVALSLFLIAIVAAIHGRNAAEEPVRARWTPSTWFVATALTSAIQLIGLVLATFAGRGGDWSDSPLLFASRGAFFFGVIALIATKKAVGDIPRRQWLAQMIASAFSFVLSISVFAFVSFLLLSDT